jgi:hypothetical protein
MTLKEAVQPLRSSPTTMLGRKLRPLVGVVEALPASEVALAE